MKKVLLVVIDALTTRVVLQALEARRLPNFARLIEAGEFHRDCTSIFPSITPAATSSIITGCYPHQHGIMGAYFYDTEEEKVSYFGDDIWTVMTHGMGRYFEDFLVRMNEERLQSRTLFELVEEAGKRSACLNYLVYHGHKYHEVSVPLMLAAIPGVPWAEKVRGPEILSLGDFVTESPHSMKEKLAAQGGLFHRFGFDDHYAGEILLQLLENGTLPDLTVAYFPDNDYRSHDVGPENAVPVLEQVDRYLGRVIDHFGGVRQMLNQVAVLISGDHSQSDIKPKGEDPGIDLRGLLQDFNVSDAGTPFDGDDEVMACPNLRAAQFYLRRGTRPRWREVVDRLLTDPRIDQVMWRDGERLGESRLHYVATQDRGQLRFWPGDDGPNTARDAFANTWSYEGDLRVIDGHVTESGRFESPQYPNAFERIVGAFAADVSGDLWATARVGHEFQLGDTHIHAGGGSHGSLHALDSTSPLILAGAPATLRLQAHLRTIDLAPICLAILDLPSPHAIGEGLFHAT